ncbi:hypothetical protein FRC04_005817 [Tulasnella sp. 424]|nr:hypothetical protein FRC04_005817 [Tulasnella sp. 424]
MRPITPAKALSEEADSDNDSSPSTANILQPESFNRSRRDAALDGLFAARTNAPSAANLLQPANANRSRRDATEDKRDATDGLFATRINGAFSFFSGPPPIHLAPHHTPATDCSTIGLQLHRMRHAICVNHLDLFKGTIKRDQDEEEEGAHQMTRHCRDSGLGSQAARRSPSTISYESTPDSRYMETDLPSPVRLYRDIGVQVDESQIDLDVSIYFDALTSRNLSTPNGKSSESSNHSPSSQTSVSDSPPAQGHAAIQGHVHAGNPPLSPSRPSPSVASSDLPDLLSFPSSQPPDNYYDTPSSAVGDPGTSESDSQETNLNEAGQAADLFVSTNGGSNGESEEDSGRDSDFEESSSGDSDVSMSSV